MYMRSLKKMQEFEWMCNHSLYFNHFVGTIIFKCKVIVLVCVLAINS